MSLACDVTWSAVLLLFAVGYVNADAAGSRELRLIPFPKSVHLEKGDFRLEGNLSIIVGKDPADRFSAEELLREILARTGIEPQVSAEAGVSAEGNHALYVRAPATPGERVEDIAIGEEKGEEGYAMRVSPLGAVVRSVGPRGLFYGVQTLKQLIRANLREGAIPCLVIRDWPSLRYRGFQDDITRGPSPLLETLRREIRVGAEVKQNFFTYYLEHQFAFAKHPRIGPKDGSLTPEELKELVAYAEKYHVEIIGNQQSFGHFEDILMHEPYAHLRETPNLLCPTNEESYKLLDDLYSEQIPLLKSDLFNVCCDETWGLGTGTSKPLAEKIGVGGVYAGHMRRVHDLLKDKYGKRMMMWGDIILQHSENLKEIPKDTVMLTWGYDARDSFEDQIIPFARSGYEFFVCPGVSCWNRILPDFGVAAKNIQNFVRDGAKHGAVGVLNTTWDDDGENLFHYNWHGIFWGAECAWNASRTELSDFNRRFGAVLLGEEGDHLGKAIAVLSGAHRLRGYDGMPNRRFYQVDLKKALTAPRVTRSELRQLSEIVGPAIEELRAARADAKVNADIVDYLIFGAERMNVMGNRDLVFPLAAKDYTRACESGANVVEAGKLVANAIETAEMIRRAHKHLKSQYSMLWRKENKPYALDVVQERFDAAIAIYDRLLEKLRAAEQGLREGKGLPSPSELGLEVVKESGTAGKE